MDVLQKLNSQGNTIVVIEHNLDVIETLIGLLILDPKVEMVEER